MSAARSLDGAYFDALYAGADDPWSFATSAYEAEKYDATLAALGGRTFARALEIGCSIGVFTERLASRCGDLLAVDISEAALARARERLRGDPRVRFEHRALPRDFPDERFDLVVLSEVGYYWSDADLSAARDRIADAARGGLLELVHFLPKVADYVRDGDAVHEAFLHDRRFAPIAPTRRAERYRIDVLTVGRPD